MMGRVALAFAFVAASVQLAASQDAPVRTLERYDDIGPALIACWKPPPGSAGMEVTIVFSMRRTGEVFGKPRISHSSLNGDFALQKRFVASAVEALARCTPLRLSDGLGGAIAGHPFAMLFRATEPRRGI